MSMQVRRQSLFGIGLSAFLVAAAFGEAGLAADTAVTTLKAAMEDRLAAMPDVARHKWNTGAAVEDRVQEAAVLTAAIDAGRRVGMEAETVRTAIESQIEAAKQIQAAVIVALQTAGSGPVAHVPDLASVLRPRIGAATTAVIETLPAAIPALRTCKGASALRSHPTTLAAFPQAWNVAADGVVAAIGGPGRANCPMRSGDVPS